MMNLHNEIINLQCRVPCDANINQSLAWKNGHKQARHDAAELANATDAEVERQIAVIAEAKKIIEELCDCYGHPMPLATLARMTPNASVSGAEPKAERPTRRES